MTTILCIDDETSALETRKLLLESEGYLVIEAKSGSQGLQLFQSEKVDLVIVDYWMPGMNGLAVAAEMKKIKRWVPIIILSGFAELPGEAVGIADRWIIKGHSTEELLHSIRALT